MIMNIKARFSDGVLTPLDPIDLKDGEVVTLHIENAPSTHVTRQDSEERLRSDSATSSFAELLGEIHESATEVSWEGLPTDGAKNLNHYLYGRPRESDR